MSEVTIPARFNGPPTTANGGYACGVAAAPLGSSAAVRLLAPPPLDVAMTQSVGEDGVARLVHGDALVADARPGRPQLDVPAPPDAATAARATERYAGRDPETHIFPTCFVCGPLREDDGLLIFPGPADGQLACPWVPADDLATDGVVDPLFVWAALDCPSGFACMPPGQTSVLASMTASVEAPVHAGDEYVVTAWKVASEGRKHRAGSAIHDADGRLVALAEALWITLREAA